MIDAFSQAARQGRRTSFFPAQFTPSPGGHAPAGGGVASPVLIVPETYSSKSITIEQTGAQIATVFPSAKKIGTLSFGANAALISVVLSSSMLSAEGLIGVFVMKDQGDTTNLSEATGVILSHLTHPSVNDFVSIPIARSNGVSFERTHAFSLPTGDALALYAFSVNDAGLKNRMAVTLAAIWASVQ